MPQTYFRPWTGGPEDGRLAHRLRVADSALLNSTRNIAVASGIYGAGELGQAREKEFQQLETEWPSLRQELIAQGDLQGGRRSLLAVFMAVQLMRTLKHSNEINFIANVVSNAAEGTVSQDVVREYLQKLDGRDPSDSEVYAAWSFITGAPEPVPTVDEAVSISMNIAVTQIAPRLEARRWTVRNFRKPDLMTNDCPVHKWSRPTRHPRLEGVGIENAEEVRFPLSPSALLVMTRGGAEPSNTSLRLVNAEICRQAHQFVVATPENLSSLNQLALAKWPPRIRFRIQSSPDGELLHMWAG
ncbi:DUF4238 domain-containing protein [Mycolicibacterium sp. BK634]|uniref:DUF4238 domain-containing protein n=1 Tax=Mycolicibacterium sp. BK634 TaxID=2587099 RepID=UPI00351D57EE